MNWFLPCRTFINLMIRINYIGAIINKCEAAQYFLVSQRHFAEISVGRYTRWRSQVTFLRCLLYLSRWIMITQDYGDRCRYAQRPSSACDSPFPFSPFLHHEKGFKCWRKWKLRFFWWLSRSLACNTEPISFSRVLLEEIKAAFRPLKIKHKYSTQQSKLPGKKRRKWVANQLIYYAAAASSRGCSTLFDAINRIFPTRARAITPRAFTHNPNRDNESSPKDISLLNKVHYFIYVSSSHHQSLK